MVAISEEPPIRGAQILNPASASKPTHFHRSSDLPCNPRGSFHGWTGKQRAETSHLFMLSCGRTPEGLDDAVMVQRTRSAAESNLGWHESW